jgi:hypothetical protein
MIAASIPSIDVPDISPIAVKTWAASSVAFICPPAGVC